jgi:hypothetical protein
MVEGEQETTNIEGENNGEEDAKLGTENFSQWGHRILAVCWVLYVVNMEVSSISCQV